MRRLVVSAAALLLVAGCGGDGEGEQIFERAEAGLSRVQTIDARLVVRALVPIERSATLDAANVPFSDLHVARWAKDARRVDCEAGLDCARAGVDVETAARELEPVLPALPIDPSSIRSAEMRVAVGKDDGRPRNIELEGEFDLGVVPVRFEADLELR